MVQLLTLLCHVLLIGYALALAFVGATLQRFLALVFVLGPGVLIAFYYLTTNLLPAENVVGVQRNILFVIIYIPLAILLRVLLSRRRSVSPPTSER